jgi:hypothetical protein
MGEETLGLRSLGADAVLVDSAMILARRKWCSDREEVFQWERQKKKEDEEIGGFGELTGKQFGSVSSSPFPLPMRVQLRRALAVQ